jgi:cell division transport system ATP-binding protein
VIWLEAVGCDRDGRVVLDVVTMGVAQGELIVVEGAVGAGKSTLLEVAAVRRLPSRGTVWFAGRNVSTLQRSSLPFVRRNIGYATPHTRLLPAETALANVALALAVRGESPSDAERAARDALALVGADQLAVCEVRALSSGQRRQVCLARALAGTPPLVVVDEPAVAADHETRQQIVSALAALRERGSAVLCGTADAVFAERLVERGGRKINLGEGRIVGAPAALLVPAFTPEPLGTTPPQPPTPEAEGGARVESPATRGSS